MLWLEVYRERQHNSHKVVLTAGDMSFIKAWVFDRYGKGRNIIMILVGMTVTGRI